MGEVIKVGMADLWRRCGYNDRVRFLCWNCNQGSYCKNRRAGTYHAA